MSALGHRNGKALDGPVRVESPARTLRVRWTLSLAALTRCRGHSAELGAALERWGAQNGDPTLEWTVEEAHTPGHGEGWAARAAILGGAVSVPLFSSNGTTRVAVIEDPGSATRHVEVRDNGDVLFSAALDVSGGSAIYANTLLLGRLGLAGGRYEVVR
jgi:hypothetical protein